MKPTIVPRNQGRPRFAPGRLVITTNAANRLDPRDVREGLWRHLSGDWGELCPEDARLNDQPSRAAAFLQCKAARQLTWARRCATLGG